MPVVEITNSWVDVKRSLKDRAFPDIEHLEAHGEPSLLSNSVIITANALRAFEADIRDFLTPLSVRMFGRYEYERRPYQNYRRYLGLRLAFASDAELFYAQMRFGHLCHSHPDED